jgi:hypothetical protein
MALLIVTETCANCGSHSGTIPLNCFDEATGATLSILSMMAETHEIVALTRKWIEQESEPLATLEFTNYRGEDVFVTYAA